MLLSTMYLCVVTFFVIYIIEWIRRLKFNSKYNKYGDLLPPGSMGLPFIGEALHLLIPSYSIDLHPFIKARIQRYGPIFRTNIAGHGVIVSTDAEVNNYILQQEGNLVELWYLDTFSKILGLQDTDARMSSVGVIHKYIKSTLLKQFGAEKLKRKLLPQIEDLANKTLNSWSTQASVEVKHAILDVLIDFTAKKLIGYDPEKSSAHLSESYNNIIDGFVSLPLNIPGTTYHKCIKGKEIVANMLRNMIKQRRTSMSRDTHEEDVLDQFNNDMDTQPFLSENFILHFVFGSLFASSETTSLLFSLIMKLLTEHPTVLQDLKAEHEVIINKRETSGSPLTWEEYKSMTFTHQVINESLRLTNGAPGLLRRAVKDITIKGVIIPAGWTIMFVTAALHLNSNTFNNPLEFNPWRWKGINSDVISKNFMPFGRGVRQCPGAEYTRVVMATFLHVLMTKYR